MEFLIRICEAQNRIRNGYMDYDEQQFISMNFNSLQDILIFGPNIISEASEFSVKINVYNLFSLNKVGLSVRLYKHLYS